MPDFLTHLRLVKFNPFSGEFTAVAAKGSVVDRSGERFDYPGSKPYFEKWSASQFEASGGQSYGNVRLQHDPKKAVGLLTEPIVCDDSAEEIRVVGKVVEPTAKELLAQGVLTGVSIGGSYVKKTTSLKDGITDYIAAPSEISVVDRPCLPQATFEIVKNEQGEVEVRKFADEKTADELIAKLYPEADLNKRLDAVQKAVDELLAMQKASEKTDKSSAKADTTKLKELTSMTFTADELTKAHKTVVDRIADCHKAASDHCAARKAAADEHTAAIHGHLAAMHKAITGEETVPMETTKTDAPKVDPVAKTDAKKDDKTMTDEQLAKTVTDAVNKILGIEPEKVLTQEEKIAKAVADVLEPLIKASNPRQAQPRATFQGVTEKAETLTDEAADKLAKASRTGDRNAILKLFAGSASEQAGQIN